MSGETQNDLDRATFEAQMNYREKTLAKWLGKTPEELRAIHVRKVGGEELYEARVDDAFEKQQTEG